jgi:hypothetical protein
VCVCDGISKEDETSAASWIDDSVDCYNLVATIGGINGDETCYALNLDSTHSSLEHTCKEDPVKGVNR